MTDTITLPRSVAEKALEALNSSMPHNNDMDHDWPSRIAARRALRAALDQPQGEQETKSYKVTGKTGEFCVFHSTEVKRGDVVYTHPQNLNCKSTQARLATLWGYERPQPPRQPLTDEEITEITFKLLNEGASMHDFARAIEAAHGIGG